MKRINQILLGTVLVAVLYTSIFVFKTPYSLYQSVETYTLQSLENTYGNQPIDAQHQELIYEIAYKMGILEEFTIRKMNTYAIQQFGYYNTVAVQPLTFSVFPFIDKPYMYVSQGFFEDLTLEEQTFLIGHELVHLKERHTRYLNLINILTIAFLFFVWWIYIRQRILTWLLTRLKVRTATGIFFLISFIAFRACVTIPHLTALTYRRHIEWQADSVSLDILNSYEGALKLLERWEKDFKIEENQGYMDIFSDHPSNSLRKKYCLEHKH